MHWNYFNLLRDELTPNWRNVLYVSAAET